MEIRKAAPEDLDAMLKVYEQARCFMRESGNSRQWVNGYPSRELLAEDIRCGQSYLCFCGEVLAAVFCFFVGIEPSYQEIREGAWKDDASYGVIHRLGVCLRRRGIASYCIEWCRKQHANLRADTHRDNLPMQECLRKNGFACRGIITLEDGSERLAYQTIES